MLQPPQHRSTNLGKTLFKMAKQYRLTQTEVHMGLINHKAKTK